MVNIARDKHILLDAFSQGDSPVSMITISIAYSVAFITMKLCDQVNEGIFKERVSLNRNESERIIRQSSRVMRNPLNSMYDLN